MPATEASNFADAVAQVDVGRKWFGFLSFPAGIARMANIDGVRSVCLWEDPVEAEGSIPENVYHVLLVANREITEVDAMEIRAQIWISNSASNQLAVI